MYGITKTQKAQAILRKKNKAEGIIIPEFKIYHKTAVIKMYGADIKTDIDQWNRIQCPKRNTCLHGQLIYNKGGKNIQGEIDGLVNKGFWENWMATCKRIKQDHFLTLPT